MPEVELEARIGVADAVAVMKLGRHLDKLRRVIDALGLTERAVYVERASLAGEVIAPLSEAPGRAHYFSMILITRGDDPWL